MKTFAGFYFDCDSTLSTIEGVDELTRKLTPAARAELKQLTQAAMDGSQSLAKIYEERLQVIAPSAVELEAVTSAYIENALPDAAATIAALRFLGKHVGVVSGGLRQPVAAFASALGIPSQHVHAVPVLFDEAGAYRDFDRRSPLWKNGGKIDVMKAIPQEHRPVAFVGDGITDLETVPVVDRFVGFGGIERRTKVEAAAEHYVTEARLAAILPHCLSEDETNLLRQHPEFHGLVEPDHHHGDSPTQNHG